MKTDLMKFYKTYLETGTLPKEGLCSSIKGRKRLLRMISTMVRSDEFDGSYTSARQWFEQNVK